MPNLRLALALLLVSCAGGPGSDAPRPPHIVIFLADDLGYRDVGFHGGEIETPHIDKLAAEGTRLSNFYVQPSCSPTRAAMLTGRYPIRMGLQVGVIRPHAKYGLDLEELLLPQALQRAGYKTAITGKWHLGTLTPAYLPTRRGFDHQYGHYLGNIDYFSHRRDGGKDWNRDDRPLQEEGYATDLIGAEAVRLVEGQDPQQPLFLFVAFNAPHTPLQVPDAWREKYAHIENPRRRSFCAMVACMDAAIGKVMDALERKGMRDDTLVMFSSDNGGSRFGDNGALRGRKGSLFEGGTRSPAVVSWPGRVRAGAICAEPLHIVDLFPTLVGLAGGSTAGSKPLDGKDAWATISTGAPSPHEEILLNANQNTAALRVGDWKLVHHRQPRRKLRNGKELGGFQLFDLRADPGETKDLSAVEPERLTDLKRRVARYRKEMRPSLGGSGPMPKGVTPAFWGHPDGTGTGRR